MGFGRRHFLKAASAGAVLSLTDISRLSAAPDPSLLDGDTPINIIIPRNYKPISDSFEYYRKRLTSATLSLINEHYSGKKLPIWDRNLDDIDLEKRLYHISYWLIKAVEANQQTYPVDPVWMMAQIMKESYFYEFAISRALAVGICQFIEPTAKSYDMLCGGTLSSHHTASYKSHELAGKADEYYRWRRQRRDYRKKNKPSSTLGLQEALQVISDGKGAQYLTTVNRQLAYNEQVTDYDRKVVNARDDFRKYLKNNVANRDLFDDSDLQFILGFDERFTYRKPIFAMAKMLAQGLKARNGNILASAVGYNAGLSSTITSGMYKPYGRIPPIEESISYLSQVLINHYEISQRM